MHSQVLTPQKDNLKKTAKRLKAFYCSRLVQKHHIIIISQCGSPKISELNLQITYEDKDSRNANKFIEEQLNSNSESKEKENDLELAYFSENSEHFILINIRNSSYRLANLEIHMSFKDTIILNHFIRLSGFLGGWYQKLEDYASHLCHFFSSNYNDQYSEENLKLYCARISHGTISNNEKEIIIFKQNDLSFFLNKEANKLFEGKIIRKPKAEPSEKKFKGSLIGDTFGDIKNPLTPKSKKICEQDNSDDSTNASDQKIQISDGRKRKSPLSPSNKDGLEEVKNAGLNENKYEDKSPQKPLGLPNIGNTCFMNSVLQCLLNNKLFIDYFIKDEYQAEINPKSKGKLTKSFASFAKKINTFSASLSRKKLFDCFSSDLQNIKQCVGKINPLFQDTSQHDAFEFLSALLEGFSQELNRVIEIPEYKQMTLVKDKKDIEMMSKEWFLSALSREASRVTDLFCGQIMNKSKCTGCSKSQFSFENYLNIPLTPGKKGKDCYDLNEIFRDFSMKTDINDILECKECKKETTFNSKSKICRLPTLLIVNLKKFQRFSGKWKKLIYDIQLSRTNELDLDKFIRKSEDESIKVTKYALFGAVEHFGELDSGHYIAYCKHPENEQWYKFDDLDVKPFDWKTCNYKTSASILFFAKKNE